MSNDVSKARLRRARSWLRRVDSTHDDPTVRRNRILAVLMALLLWALTLYLGGPEPLLAEVARPSDLLPFLGQSVSLLVSLFAIGLYLSVLRPALLTTPRRVLLLATVALLSTALARITIYGLQTSQTLPAESVGFLLPLPLAPLLVTILLDGAAGIAVGLWTSLVMYGMAERSLPILVAGMIATAIGAATAGHLRTRAQIMRAGLLIGLSEVTCVFAVTAVGWEQAEVTVVVQQAAACLLSGTLSAVLALLVLPLFEFLFRITTDVTLLEISDLGHPLLQRLAIEAPGTYHHSLVVATLAHAAADEIGANALLARVGSYYHDIGKLTKPHFFAENLRDSYNPHDRLSPSMSALIVTGHVKEGLSLATFHKLPEPILAIIREHHGTSVVTFFHHKARQQQEQERERQTGGAGWMGGALLVEESAFRHGGPKPASRESAIISLADAVEAATRSLERPTRSALGGVVDEIVLGKFRDGQLDECGLTLAELPQVKGSFVSTLVNMLHVRMAYPRDEDNDTQPTAPPPGEHPGAAETERHPDEPGTEPGAGR